MASLKDIVRFLVLFVFFLRIYVDLAVFQPYLDLEAGDNQSLKIQDIVRKILELQRQGYSNLRCKAMWKLLNTQYRLLVTKETTRAVLKCIDPTATRMARKSRHCLQRRNYGSQGPSFIIHVDEYDKLKPFGM